MMNHTMHHTHTAPAGPQPHPFMGLPPPRDTSASQYTARKVESTTAQNTGTHSTKEGSGDASLSSLVWKKKRLLRAEKMFSWMHTAMLRYITATISQSIMLCIPISCSHWISPCWPC